MPELYLIIVVLLFVLAISDLIVGVSNDAVNFLNSAIGSKVASRRTIMVVASFGILIGATFSSGMMEVARKGIFNPEYFFFAEIMVIFLAVMITDIILLDLFNTFGMPTSTTVSIVFELLGAAVAVSILKISQAGESIARLSDYINSSSAILIISGIFLSVLIAFAVGAFVQYVSRLIFTFHVHKRLSWVGSIWSGLALAALTYFLLIKGMKGASFVSDSFVDWVQENTLMLLALSFVFWSIVMQVLLLAFKVNILRIVVLFGTFALAMAFSGNDLVNFIGVPIAGFESYMAWSATDTSATEYSMAILNEPVRTKTYLLIIAGLIMITTLWFSKKARSVTETEVNLGRQNEGTERFQPNMLSKGIVRYSLALGNGLQHLLPDSWLNSAESSFQPYKEPVPEGETYDAPAFDLVRASVNLTVASVLIAFATSLKLPLSTTYVSFMVAMGTSLADRAWGRSSAVYRIAGVLNVIGGWFFTAIMAFTVAATFATLIFFFKGWAIAGLVLLAVFLITRTFLLHRSKEKAQAAMREFQRQTKRLSPAVIVAETEEKVGETLRLIRKAYRDSLKGLLQEDLDILKKAKKTAKQLKVANEELQLQLYGLIKRIDEQETEASRLYLTVYDMEQDLVQSTVLIVKRCREYVDNSMDPLQEEQAALVRQMFEVVDQYLAQLIDMAQKKQFETKDTIVAQKQAIFDELETVLVQQVEGIKKGAFGMRNSLLIFGIALETKDIIAVAARFAKLYYRVEQNEDPDDFLLMWKGSNKR